MVNRNVGIAWAKKAYLWLSLVVVAIIWIAFFVHFVILGHAPVEANWGEEVGKWLLMTPILVGIVDAIAYAWIGTVASRRAHGLEGPLAKEREAEAEQTVELKEEVNQQEEIAAPAPKKTRKKTVVEE